MDLNFEIVFLSRKKYILDALYAILCDQKLLTMKDIFENGKIRPYQMCMFRLPHIIPSTPVFMRTYFTICVIRITIKLVFQR